jgi:hypothetical protein
MNIEIEASDLDISVKSHTQLEFAGLDAHLDRAIIITDELDQSPTTFRNCCEIQIVGIPKILYFLDGFSTGLQDVQIFYVSKTDSLFIGGKSSSFVINLKDLSVKYRNHHLLFWTFRYTPNKDYVIDEGEIESVLRKLNGGIVKSVNIEPPYEYELIENGIEYTCVGISGKVQMLFED